ncbi:MAG: S-layer homology domain-containing protein [Clostridiales bacterium]|jgi:hypothetical protein|nr:S-layer homology domain-containing protein [Eubacteriales bacterium]MDH7566227.1 S-layer homology domain-containing protein [Clostridiales bacterium]
MKTVKKIILPLLLALVLIFGTVPPALASDSFTADIQVEGQQVAITGNTTVDTYVSLIVESTVDGEKCYMDQTRSDKSSGAYSFTFPMEEGSYKTVLTSNGITVQPPDFTIKNSADGTVTVRVEGAQKTLLPETQVDILVGQTTLLEAVRKALEAGGVTYTENQGMLDTISGEEGWQWLVNGTGGMTLPSALLADKDEIVLVDDLLWDPVLTKITLSAFRVDVGGSFTATLNKVQGTALTPAAGQTLYFDSVSKTTDQNGQAVFTGTKEGNYYVTAPSSGSLVRPVPVSIRVGKPTGDDPGNPVPDSNIHVQMRIEGYKGTIYNSTVVFDPSKYRTSDGKYKITDPDGNSHSFSKATVLLATIVAWNEAGIRDNLIKSNDNYVARMAGEEEFDFRNEHITCGWMVRVNNKVINQGTGVWPIKDGDRVDWYYTDLYAYYGSSIGVSPTSLDAGGTIKVKVTGQTNNNWDGGSGSTKTIEGASVYVGGTERAVTGPDGTVEIKMDSPGTYEVYAVKLDKNSTHGSYYFPILSKTETVSVTVKGDASNTTGEVATTGETTAVDTVKNLLNEAGKVIIGKDKIKVENGKATALVGTEELSAALKGLSDQLDKIKKAGTLTEDELKSLQKKVTLVVPEQKTPAVAVKLDAKAVGLLKQADTVEIATEVASFDLTSRTFGEAAKGKEISLAAEKVDYADLSESAKAQVPKGSVIVNLEARVGGTVVKSFKEPMRVSIPYTGSVKNGDRLTVFLLKEDGSTEPVGGIYDARTRTVNFLTGHFSRYFVKESARTFGDAEQVTWARDAVAVMAGKGIIRGKGEDAYDPFANVTRAEFCALIGRMMKYEGTSAGSLPFKDVKADSWYYSAVAAAYEKGLVSGKTADAFDPEGFITRQEMAAIMGKVLEQAWYRPGDEKQLNIFPDRQDIASWAKTGAAALVREGIIKGMEDGSFAPGKNATRAETAVMLYRLYKLVL